MIRELLPGRHALSALKASTKRCTTEPGAWPWLPLATRSRTIAMRAAAGRTGAAPSPPTRSVDRHDCEGFIGAVGGRRHRGRQSWRPGGQGRRWARSSPRAVDVPMPMLAHPCRRAGPAIATSRRGYVSTEINHWSRHRGLGLVLRTPSPGSGVRRWRERRQPGRHLPDLLCRSDSASTGHASASPTSFHADGREHVVSQLRAEGACGRHRAQA